VEGYVTDVIADDAIAFIDRGHASDAPFFLAVNFTAPHKPFAGQHPQEFTSLYERCEFRSCPQGDPHPWLATIDGAPIGGEQDTRSALVGYFAAVSAMDAAIGRILDRLQQHGAADDTVVIFTSDNGFNCGHHGVWGKGNGTYPQNMYDESVLVPFIVAYPPVVRAGLVIDQLVSAYDFAATLLELAGLPQTEFEVGPGRSFAPILTGETDALDRDIVVHGEYGAVRMIRTQDLKYVHRHPVGPHELYDLSADPGETSNLVDDSSRANELESMRMRLHAWFARHGSFDCDGSALPVTGAGQLRPLDCNPLAAFGSPSWDIDSTPLLPRTH
jgi:choline-sulfatase